LGAERIFLAHELYERMMTMMTKTLWVFLTLVLAMDLLVGLGPVRVSLAEEKQPDYTSRVPQYTFADTLEEQEAQLKTNPLLLRMIASRKKQAGDVFRPIYHYVSAEGDLNDPNGLCFWQGRWHLFYQLFPPEDGRPHWGHVVSDDLIHWRDLPLAIYPHPEEACFSGTIVIEEGRRAIAAYHGLQRGTMVAVSSDPLLLNWEKVTGKEVIPQHQPGEALLRYDVFDPCIWKKEGAYYVLTAGGLFDGPGGRQVRAMFLHRSKDLVSWDYLHPFLENDQYGMIRDDGACPYFWPIGDRHILLHYSHLSGGKYMLGDYDKKRDKFVVTYGSDFNFGPSVPAGVHAPTAYPDGKGGVIALFNMNKGYSQNAWSKILTLPRRLTLIGKDQLGVEPAGDVESLRGKHSRVDTMTLPANEDVVMENVRGNAMEIIAEIDTGDASMIEMSVLRSPNAEEVTRIVFFRDRGYFSQEVTQADILSNLIKLVTGPRAFVIAAGRPLAAAGDRSGPHRQGRAAEAARVHRSKCRRGVRQRQAVCRRACLSRS
jgi:beta-fructofuranosidase